MKKGKTMQQLTRHTSKKPHSSHAGRKSGLWGLAILAGPCFMALLAACGGVSIEEESSPEALPLETVNSERVAQGGMCGLDHLYATNTCYTDCQRHEPNPTPCYSAWQCQAVTYQVYGNRDGSWSHYKVSATPANHLRCSPNDFPPNGCPTFCN